MLLQSITLNAKPPNRSPLICLSEAIQAAIRQLAALLTLVRSFSLPEWRMHPWRYATAVLAVSLGVALGLAVQIINRSAVGEFDRAARSVEGTPDVQLKATQEYFDEALLAVLLRDPAVAAASPVLELAALAVGADSSPSQSTPTAKIRLSVVGVDVFAAAAISPATIPRPDDATGGNARSVMFAPSQLFLNAAARAQLTQSTPLRSVELQNGLEFQTLRVAGSVNLAGRAAAVMDLGAMQDQFGLLGRLSRIDIRLREGVDADRWQQSLKLPAGVLLAKSGNRAERASESSRAYRANMTVLALVALFVGGYLVFSVVALSVSKRLPQWALLGVLGLSGRERARLVMAEATILGLIGAVLGLAMGLGLATLALERLGGDLGGGYFSSQQKGVVVDAGLVLLLVIYGALGLVATWVGAWWPAQSTRHMSAAAALKGMGLVDAASFGSRGFISSAWLPWALLACGAAMCALPPIAQLSLGAYVGIGALLVGGVGALPPLLAQGARYAQGLLGAQPLASLALARAHRVRHSAAASVSGVVASLSLAVALMVMVASFRDGVTAWLDVMLPAPLYMRVAPSGAGDAVHFSPSALQSMASAPGVARFEVQRGRALSLNPRLPSVYWQSRGTLGDSAASDAKLPWVTGSPLDLSRLAGDEVAIYVSEAVVELHAARLGDIFEVNLPLVTGSIGSGATDSGVTSKPLKLRVMGVWRDYARQHGAIWLTRQDDLRLTGDPGVSDVLVWPKAGVATEVLRASLLERLRPAMPRVDELVEVATSDDIRRLTYTAFDRSFAVTTWLQAVAIGIGLFGVAASFSAQVLARRKEFGLLAHLGLTRAQILRLVSIEGALWTSIGALAGLGLGLCVAVVLVKVVNPQSFHWTMDLSVPWMRVWVLMAVVVLAGTLTTWLAGRAAVGRSAVMAVKEDW